MGLSSRAPFALPLIPTLVIACTSEPFPRAFYDCEVLDMQPMDISGGAAGETIANASRCVVSEIGAESEGSYGLVLLSSASEDVRLWINFNPAEDGVALVVVSPSDFDDVEVADGEAEVFMARPGSDQQVHAVSGALTFEGFGPSGPDATTFIHAADLDFVDGSVVSVSGRVRITSHENICQPYAEGVVRVADEYGCAGAGSEPEELEASCEEFVGSYVEGRSCVAPYVAYLECAANAQSCNPCRAEYCAFNTCMCAASDDDLCLPECS